MRGVPPLSSQLPISITPLCYPPKMNSHPLLSVREWASTKVHVSIPPPSPQLNRTALHSSPSLPHLSSPTPVPDHNGSYSLPSLCYQAQRVSNFESVKELKTYAPLELIPDLTTTPLQVELWTNKTYSPGVHLLPRIQDEEVARCHLEKLGITLDTLSSEQAAYINVDPSGPYKPDYYRY